MFLEGQALNDDAELGPIQSRTTCDRHMSARNYINTLRRMGGLWSNVSCDVVFQCTSSHYCVAADNECEVDQKHQKKKKDFAMK